MTDLDIGRSLQQAVLALLILWHVCAIVLGGVVRLGLHVYWVGNFVRVLNPAILLLAAVMFFVGRSRKVDSFALIAGAMVLFGTWSGLLWGNGAAHFLSHFFSGVSVFGLYIAAVNQRWDEEVLLRFVSGGAAVITILFTAAIAWFWITSLIGRPIYLGLPANILVWPLGYYVLSGRRRRAWLVGGLILLSGKRTSMLGLVVALLLLSRWVRRRKPGTKLAVVPLVLGLALVVLSVVTAAVDLGTVPVIGPIWSKWAMINPLGSGFDLTELNRTTGQRVAEVLRSMALFTSSVWYAIIGLGYGWTYESPILFEGSYEAHYVHLSPLNYVYQYGVLLAGIFLTLLVRKVVWIGDAIDADDPVSYTLWLTLVGLLVMGLAGYSYAVDPTIWLTLGILTSIARQNAAASHAIRSNG